MNFDSYTSDVESLIVYPRDRWQGYLALACANEVGEVLGVLKKQIRNDTLYPEKLMDEMGDVVFYCTALGIEAGFTLLQLFEKYSLVDYEKSEDYWINKILSAVADLHWQLTQQPEKHHVFHFVVPVFTALVKLMDVYGFTLHDVMQANMDKLEGRRETNTIKEHS